MGRKYRPKSETGDEYVEDTKKLYRYTQERISVMPPEMKEYILDPMYKVVLKATELVIEANAVYIHKTNDKEMMSALKERDDILVRALRQLDVYDFHFDNLMQGIDLLASEKTRMKNLFEQMLQEEGYSLDGRPENRNDNHLTVNVINHPSEIEYVINNNRRVLRTGLTLKKKDHWLLLETKARDGIAKRISKDRDIIERTEKKQTA